MIDTLMIKLTQFEITGSIGKLFNPLENLKIEIHLIEIISRSRFRDLYTFAVR